MRALMTLVVVFALTACDPAPGSDNAPVAPPGGPAASEQPQLPAAEPTELPLAEFRNAARRACVDAQQAIGQAPLRGDPLGPNARRRDVVAAVNHYRAAARAWTVAANELFTFGLPREEIAQSFISALDALALRSQQAADAFGVGDPAQTQGAVSFAEDAHRAADLLGRELGLEPLNECGRRQRRADRRLRVVATDFDFRMKPPQRGRTRIVLRNAGDEDHHLFVVRLREPGTVDEAIRADRATGDPSAFLAGEGDVTATIAPGERTAMTVNFRPGPYAVLCFVASPDGTPHAYKGMSGEVFITD